MKTERIGRLFALVALVGFVGVAPVTADDDETPLGEQMETVSGSLKKLRKADGFEPKAALVRDAQAAIIKSLQFLPAMFKDIKDAQAKAKARADFTRLMGLALSGLGELELAFLNEDEDKADEVLDKLKDLKKEGHKAYIEEDE
jgi:hypothetical protein